MNWIPHHRIEPSAEAVQAADKAVDALKAALAAAGIKLPSLHRDVDGGVLGTVVLVELGRARPDVVMRLVDVVREGAKGSEESGR